MARPLMMYWAYDYERDVAQVSGAGLMTRRAVPGQAGGLDERF